MLLEFATDAEAQAEIDFPPDLRAKYRRYANKYEAAMQRVLRARQVVEELEQRIQAITD